MGRAITTSCFKPWCPYAFGVAYSEEGVLLNEGVDLDDAESWCRVSRCIIYTTQKAAGLCEIVGCHWREFQMVKAPKIGGDQ